MSKLVQISRRRTEILLAAATALFLPRALKAQTTDWTDGSSNWNNAVNWDNGVPSTAGETVNVINADNTNRTITYDYNGPAVTLGTVTFSNTGGGTNSLSMTTSGLALSATNENIGGYSGSVGAGVGAVIQSAGSNTVLTCLYMATNTADSASYTLSGNGTLDVATPVKRHAGFSELIGYSGTGAFVQSGGTNTATGALVLGENPGAVGTYTLSGSGSLNPLVEVVGDNGTGNFIQNGGTNTLIYSTASSLQIANSQLAVGNQSGSTGTYTLSGTGLLAVTGTEDVGGVGGTGIFNQSGGTNTILSGTGAAAGTLSVGDDGTGTYNLSGTGAVICQGDSSAELIGDFGQAIFNQTGGTNTTSGLLIEAAPGYTATYNLSGTGILTAGLEQAGKFYGGIISQGGGTNNVNLIWLGIGVLTGTEATGTYVLSGTGALLDSGGEQLGLNSGGAGYFYQSGGANTITAGGLSLGTNGGTGTYVLTAGTATVSGGVSVGGGGGTGVLSVSNTGVLNADTITAVSAPGTGITLSGGTINTAALNFNGAPSVFNWTAGTLGLTAGVTFDPAAGPTSTGAAFGPSLTLGANQTLNVTGNETLGGTGSFSMTMNSGSAHSVSGILTVNAGSSLAVLGGKLTLNGGGVINTGGTLTIQSPGTIDVTNTSLVINYNPAADPINAIRAALISGAAWNGSQDTWAGTGIISSTAALSFSNPQPPQFGGKQFVVGYLDGNSYFDSQYGTVGANQILIKYTVAGDAFLENSVGFQDLLDVAAHYDRTGLDYAQGNFFYNPAGSVGFADLLAVAQSYGESFGSSGSADGGNVLPLTLDSSVSAVPEPGSFILIAAGAGGLLARRRR